MDGTPVPPAAAATLRPWETVAGIEAWLAVHVARSAQIPAEDVDVTHPFSHYALDSVATVELTADLEDWLALSLPPTLLWDYPTIASLARHLHGQKAGAP
jgi:acyl carrier protein